MELERAGREYFYWPFWSTTELTALTVNIGSGWVDMEAQPDYVPATPVADNAQWFRILIAGPAATSNPAGTAVLAASVRVRFKITDNPEIVVRSDSLLRLI